MSVSQPFIDRPIATSLLAFAILLGGILGYSWLPVSALPQVDFPTIQVTTQLPGANPDTMASLVTAPLERQLGQIPSLSLLTSSSAFGLSQVTLQFVLGRDIDGAAQDVQAAINAAASTLPRNLPYPPVYSKVNPADSAIVTLALSSKTYSIRQLSDLGDKPGSPIMGSVWRIFATPLAMPMWLAPRARLMGHNNPIRLPPMISCTRRKTIKPSSSPIATARRSS
jgi:multidrug efflux pump